MNIFKPIKKAEFTRPDHYGGEWAVDDYKTGKVVETDELIFQSAFPRVNSTTGMVIANASGSSIVTFDSVNSRVGINITPSYNLDIYTPIANTSAIIHVAGNNKNGAVVVEDTRTGGEACNLLAGTSASVFTFSSTGNFSIYSTTKANVLNASGSGTNRFHITGTNGNVGIATATPEQPLDVNSKVGFTMSGGLCIKLKAQELISGGYLCRASRTQGGYVLKCGLNDGANGRDQPIGVAVSTAQSGADIWIVTNGIAELWNSGEANIISGDFLQASDSISGAIVGGSASPPVPADANHWRECGHAISSVTGAGLFLGVIHFN